MSAQRDRLRRRLKAIPAATIAATAPALRKAADQMADTMLQFVPVDTGELAESITVTPAGHTTPPYSQPGGSMSVPANAVAVTVGNADVRYGHLVEYGTTKAPPDPFFWPAVRLHRKKATSSIKRAVAKAVRSTKA
ncbi:HK97-gp10 family putative phage morphogenesis protein [Ancylobacter vacuolatus]|uniref:HK97 gp10 family phage protein n=1 Tax=Ancylobacter vacuolatus TaxID=223389 RepID=A0ABU0DHI4_9HYPH|nr:HK97-gp10 family putative phage morphogenesis protein [Ancylobacter vacuolatus]MDQ0347859.1 HK97 gp10 family phage protein [Ancylobacter vacuolatus]